MCHSLLRVTYRNDKNPPDVVPCESEEHQRTKIAEIQARSEVQRIAVFGCDYHIERVEDWRSTPYITPTPSLVKDKP